MRVNKNVPQKERRRFSLDHFGGVDFGSSPLLCDPHRSPDAVNFIGDHGINRKRNGWEQVVETVDGKIHCIHQVNDDTIVVIGSTHRAILKKVDGYWKKESEDAAECPNRVTPVSFNNKVFFIGAGSLHWDYDKNGLKEFTEENYYIPTTTIDIDPINEPDIRSTLDMPNLLRNLRKNTMRGSSKDGSTYMLDGKVSMKVEGDLFSKTYTLSDFLINVLIGDSDYKIDMSGSESFDGSWPLSLVNHAGKKIGFTLTVDTSIYNQTNFGKATLTFDNNTYDEKSTNNITVTYAATTLAGGTGVINTYLGHIGTSFGIDGMNDRLFVAGHPDHPNVIFFSDIDNPTYFPDQYTISVGTPNSKIIGLLRLSDDVMAVFKEPSQSDVCLYFIKGSYRNIYDEAGNIKKVLPVFSVTAESFNESPVNSHTCFNFNGDSIFLSKRGIYGIEPEQNIAADIRVARDRSYAINQKLASSELSEAVGIVNGSKCYFSDGENCYVADSAYRYVPNGALSYNYEWWYWNNIPAISFGIVDGELWFGTKEGRICRFVEKYLDSQYDINKSGEIAYEGESEAFTYDDNSYDQLVFNNRRVRIANLATDKSGKDLANVDLYMCNVDRENNTFQLSRFATVEGEDPEPIQITITLTDDYTNPILRFYTDTPVKAYWTTPPLDLGNDSIAKCLYTMTVTAETGKNAKFKFGYDTRMGRMERASQGLGAFSFDNIDFRDLSFETGFQNSFTVRARERNFNFIRFNIKSDEDAPCAVHRISAVYKYNKNNKGVV